jgi:hypothetical protein
MQRSDAPPQRATVSMPKMAHIGQPVLRAAAFAGRHLGEQFLICVAALVLMQVAAKLADSVYKQPISVLAA